MIESTKFKLIVNDLVIEQEQTFSGAYLITIKDQETNNLISAAVRKTASECQQYINERISI